MRACECLDEPSSRFGFRGQQPQRMARWTTTAKVLAPPARESASQRCTAADVDALDLRRDGGGRPPSRVVLEHHVPTMEKKKKNRLVERFFIRDPFSARGRMAKTLAAIKVAAETHRG